MAIACKILAMNYLSTISTRPAARASMKSRSSCGRSQGWLGFSGSGSAATTAADNNGLNTSGAHIIGGNADWGQYFGPPVGGLLPPGYISALCIGLCLTFDPIQANANTDAKAKNLLCICRSTDACIYCSHLCWWKHWEGTSWVSTVRSRVLTAIVTVECFEGFRSKTVSSSSSNIERTYTRLDLTASFTGCIYQLHISFPANICSTEMPSHGHDHIGGNTKLTTVTAPKSPTLIADHYMIVKPRSFSDVEALKNMDLKVSF